MSLTHHKNHPLKCTIQCESSVLICNSTFTQYLQWASDCAKFQGNGSQIQTVLPTMKHLAMCGDIFDCYDGAGEAGAPRI